MSQVAAPAMPSQTAPKKWKGAFGWWVDGLIAALYLLGAISGALVSRDANHGWPVENTGFVDAVLIAVLCLTTAGILIRRVHPLLAVTACGVGLAGLLLFGLGLQYDVLAAAMGFFVLIVLQTSVARRCSWKVAVGSLLAIILSAGLTVALTRQLSWSGVVSGVSVGAFVLTVATAVGVILRLQSGFHKAEIASRREAERRDRAFLIERAATDARAEVAREMHDVIAHGLTVVISLADSSAALVAVDPEQSRQSMEEAGEAGRRALAELRRMLGAVDHADAATRVPIPRSDDVPALIAGFRAAGLPVELITRGDREPSTDEQARELAIYRVVQESLTNALRHASGLSVVSVTIDERTDGTLVDVSDDGSRTPGQGSAALAGRGLTGMAERVALFGGTVDAGPLANGQGWCVNAWLPAEDR